MLITTVKPGVESRLRSLVQNPGLVSAVSSDLRPAPSLPGEQTVAVEQAPPLVASPRLLPGLQLPATRQAGRSDFETVKLIAQEFLLPAVSTVWPDAKPYVSGAQAVWATAEFWQAVTDEEVDSTKRTIKGIRAAQKALNALLTFQNAPAFSVSTNMLAGYMIATADKLYVVRKGEEKR